MAARNCVDGGDGENDASESRAKLARRISFWTTNLIATGFVLIVAVVLGQQLIDWWRPGPASVQQAIPSADQGDDVVLLFGDAAHTLRRQEHRGDLHSALDALESLCLTSPEVTRRGPLQLAPPGEQEQRLLRRLATQEPSRTAETGLQIHRWEAGFPMVVGVMPVEEPIVANGDTESNANHSEAAVRVVTWGLAIPYAENAWRLMSLQPRITAGESPPLSFMPAGAEHVMTIRGEDGASIMVLQSNDATLEQWQRYFDEKHTLGPATTWQHFADGWNRQVTLPDGNLSIRLSCDQASGKLQAVVVRQPLIKLESTTELKE